MSYLARLSFANRSIVALVTIAVLLFGAFVIPSLKQELFPSIEFPTVTIVSIYPGASPAQVENDVTNPIEQNIQGLQGIQSYTSYSNQGTSIIVVSYDYGTDLNQARQNLTQITNKLQSTLPANVTPQVQSFNIADFPIIQLAVSSSDDPTTLATHIKQEVLPSLQGINGVGNATVTGVRNQLVTIDLDLQKLQDAGLTVSQVTGVLQANNASLPAGSLTSNGQTVSISVGNTFSSLQDLQNLIVGVRKSSQSIPGSSQTGGQTTGTTTTPSFPVPVKLSDVATVQQTLAPSSTLTRTNGKPTLGIAITKTTSGNTVSISQAVNDLLPGLQHKLGNGAQISVVSDQAPYIRTSVDGLTREGLIGAGFAILVILLFLFSIRSTLVTAVSIPLSIVIALIALWVGNYSLNILTLGGLTIAVGRVVDDSIVVLENIYRHIQHGEDKGKAIITAVQEVAGAVTSSTITTVAVFLPIAFTSGLVGELFRSFAISVTVALLASLIVALTVIPVLAYWFLKEPSAKKQVTEEKETMLEKAYTPILRWVTNHQAITIVAALVLLIGSLSLSSRLETNLFGRSGQNTLTISQQLAPGTSLDRTDQAAQKVEAILASVSGIKTYQVTVGSGGALASLSGSSGTSTATYAITTDVNADQTAIENTLRSRLGALTDAGTFTISAGGGGPSNSNLEVDIQASNDQTLKQVAQQVLASVSQVPDLVDIRSNLNDAGYLIDVHVDPTKALGHGMTAIQVAQALRQVYTGTTITQITLNGIQQNVDLRLGTPADTVTQMQDLLIPTPLGNVRLGDLATIQQVNGPTQITHIGGARTATITATVTTQNVGAVSSNVQQQINKLKLPDGVTVSLGGVSASQSQTFRDLGLALLVAILLVYVVMVATFRSLLQPLILLVSIPFAATGSILLLLATHTSLGAPALIGLLLLVGIVVTNAIVLIDLVNQYRKRGLDARMAVIEGGRRRLRPILMTAIATILALMPLALGYSSSSGFISGPLAVVVIGGLTSSTLLTLLIVPTLYVLVEDIKDRLAGRRKTPKQEMAEPQEDEMQVQPV